MGLITAGNGARIPSVFQRIRKRETMTKIDEYDKNDANLLIKRVLPDGRCLRLYRQLFNLALTIAKDDQDDGFTDTYEFDSAPPAIEAAKRWDGEGDPVGWIRHKPSNRRRVGGDPAREEVRP